MNGTRFVKIGALALAFAALLPGSREEKELLRVGVFDSRAVAIAFAASPQHAAFMEEIRARDEQARGAGDEETTEEIGARMTALQARMHKQGFSTAPVDDILKHVEADLPEIARSAGVDLIVNKWRLAFVDPAADLVDVTDLLIESFEPEGKTLDYLSQLDEHEPLPLYETDWEEVEKH